MEIDEYQPVRVSRRIEAPRAVVFGILADPRQHLALDGSDMLRGAVTTGPLTGVGDVFVMKMYYSRLGEYEMNNHVVEFEPDRRIGWEPEAGRGHPDAAPDSPEPARWGHRWSRLPRERNSQTHADRHCCQDATAYRHPEPGLLIQRAL